MARMLKPELIPPCLWDAGSGTLRLPTALMHAFENTVDRRGVRHLLSSKSEEGPIGGRTEDETLTHFVNRFDGSSARLQLAFLDPHGHLDETSNVILSRLSGGITCFVDAPCGAGAGFLSLLLTVARLRELEVLPRTKLEVRLVAADISEAARVIAGELLDSVRDELEEQAIFVKENWAPWDVTSNSSTVALNKIAVRKSDGCGANFLLVANFSGYLVGGRKLHAAEPQLYELFKYFSADDSYSVWVEPNTNKAAAKGGMLHWLLNKILTNWSWFARAASVLGDDSFGFVSEAKFHSVLRRGEATARVCVSHIRLVNNG